MDWLESERFPGEVEWWERWLCAECDYFSQGGMPVPGDPALKEPDPNRNPAFDVMRASPIDYGDEEDGRF